MLELKTYASRPIKAVQVIDVNDQGIELLGLFDDAEETIKIYKYDKKLGKEVAPAVRLKVLTGRGTAKIWRPCHDGDWIIEEHDGTKRVFRDHSFRNTFQGPEA